MTKTLPAWPAVAAAVLLAPVLAWAQTAGQQAITPREPIAPYSHREPLVPPRTTSPGVQQDWSDPQPTRVLRRDSDNAARRQQQRILRQDRSDRLSGRR